MKNFRIIVLLSLVMSLYGEIASANYVCNRIRRAVEDAYIIRVDDRGVDIYLDGRRRRFSHAQVEDKLDDIRSRVRRCNRDIQGMVYDLIDDYYSRRR